MFAQEADHFILEVFVERGSIEAWRIFT